MYVVNAGIDIIAYIDQPQRIVNKYIKKYYKRHNENNNWLMTIIYVVIDESAMRWTCTQAYTYKKYTKSMSVVKKMLYRYIVEPGLTVWHVETNTLMRFGW